jgi:hypothetical protein
MMMKKIVLIALVITFPAIAQTDQRPSEPRTDREQVQADRAKAAADEKSAPATRPWDRDADGKRPWERKTPAR